MTKIDENLYGTIIKLIEKSMQVVMDYGDKKRPERVSTDEIARQTAFDILQKYSERTKSDLKSLRDFSEWDFLTLAFYGETNAGKSTLIEVLRIALGEESKKITQNEYREKIRELNIDFDEVSTISEKISLMTSLLANKESDFQDFQTKLLSTQRKLQEELQKIRKDTFDILQKQSLWKKFIRIFKKSDEELYLAAKETGYQELIEKNSKAIATNSKEIKNIEVDLWSAKRDLSFHESKYKSLIPLQDGEIIGDGRSDFTLETKSYTFSVGEQKVRIIDVPGIEGNEQKVHTSIDAAVKKAHLIFYITRKATPPGSGGDGQEGTIDKIKRQLGSQTEVWAIYNKSVTNPLALQAKSLINEGEVESLKVMDKALRESLGSAYQRCLLLSAMPAFYAKSECLLPVNPIYKNQQKFLSSMNRAEIFTRSGLTKFVNFITTEIPKNYEAKIHFSNLKKIRSCLEDGLKFLAEAIKTLSDAAEPMTKQIAATNTQLESLLDSMKKSIKSVVRDNLEKLKSDIRTDVYGYIAGNVSNDEFKEYLKQRLDVLKDDLGPLVERSLKSEFSYFQEKVGGIVKSHQSNIDDILKYKINAKFSEHKAGFGVDFNMNNGINMIGLMSSLGGAVSLIYGVFFASNPVGLAAMTVIGAIGLIFSFYKAVRSFFSSDYKMEQQRKSTDENIKNIFTGIENELIKMSDDACKQIDDEVVNLKINLQSTLDSSKRSIEALQLISRQVSQIHQKMV